MQHKPLSKTISFIHKGKTRSIRLPKSITAHKNFSKMNEQIAIGYITEFRELGKAQLRGNISSRAYRELKKKAVASFREFLDKI